MSSHRHHRHRRSRKVRLHLSREEAAAYLRDLADQLAAGRVRVGGSDLELGDGTARVRQSVEEKHGRRRVEVRLRVEVDDHGEGRLSSPSYAALKKRMKEELRELRRAIERGAPALELVRAFEADAIRMVQFPGKGDADYPAFTAAVGELRSAAEAGEAEPLREALDALDRLRRRCHRRYC